MYAGLQYIIVTLVDELDVRHIDKQVFQPIASDSQRWTNINVCWFLARYACGWVDAWMKMYEHIASASGHVCKTSEGIIAQQPQFKIIPFKWFYDKCLKKYKYKISALF